VTNKRFTDKVNNGEGRFPCHRSGYLLRRNQTSKIAWPDVREKREKRNAAMAGKVFYRQIMLDRSAPTKPVTTRVCNGLTYLRNNPCGLTY